MISLHKYFRIVRITKSSTLFVSRHFMITLLDWSKCASLTWGWRFFFLRLFATRRLFRFCPLNFVVSFFFLYFFFSFLFINFFSFLFRLLRRRIFRQLWAIQFLYRARSLIADFRCFRGLILSVILLLRRVLRICKGELKLTIVRQYKRKYVNRKEMKSDHPQWKMSLFDDEWIQRSLKD